MRYFFEKSYMKIAAALLRFGGSCCLRRLGLRPRPRVCYSFI